MGTIITRGKLCLACIMLIGLFAHAQTYIPHQWGAVAMGGGGFVSAVITCPTEKNLIYARTDVGGAYRWVEATKSWTHPGSVHRSTASSCVAYQVLCQ